MINQNINLSKWLILINPAAGNGKGEKKWPYLKSLLEQFDFEFEFHFTKTKGHAIQLAKEGIEKGFRKIMAIGGDGTGHEVVNGIFEQKECPTTEILFTLLTIGTGNDWIKTHKIPKDFKRWLPLIKKEKTIFQDIGLVQYHLDEEMKQRYFFNVAGMAYDGFLGKKLSKRSEKITNKFLYLFAIASWLFKYKLTKTQINFNNQKIEGYFYTINIGICKYSGGGMLFVPHGNPTDGKMALTIVRKVPKWLVLLLTPFFYNGKLNWLPVVSLHKTKRIVIESLENLPCDLEVDGEYLGETPVQFEIIEKALKIIVP
jgi:YegS/Rv2252/BmrU family lipid kinase